MEGALVGLGFGVVLSLPALVVLGFVTRDAGQTLASWPSVAVPVGVIGTVLGALAAGRHTPPVAPAQGRAAPRRSSR